MNLPCSCSRQLSLLSLDAGTMKLANKAALWYVPCSLQNVEKIMEVPPIQVECVEDVAGFRFHFAFLLGLAASCSVICIFSV